MTRLVVKRQPALETPNFVTIYRAHFRYVWRLLARLGVREADLEDVAQELFLTVNRRLSDFDPSREIRPWLAGFAYRMAAAERRRARHRHERLTDIERGEARSTPEKDLQVAQRCARVYQVLNTMSDDRRAVFVMFEMEQMTGSEIASALNIPLNTVHSRLRLARADFKATHRRLRLLKGEA